MTATAVAPTAPYTTQTPPAYAAAPYWPWLIDRIVRVTRERRLPGRTVDEVLAQVLSDYRITVPAGGFVDSDGVNVNGERIRVEPETASYDEDGFDGDGFDRDGFDEEGLNEDGQTRSEYAAGLVAEWTPKTAAAILASLATRVA